MIESLNMLVFKKNNHNNIVIRFDDSDEKSVKKPRKSKDQELFKF